MNEVANFVIPLALLVLCGLAVALGHGGPTLLDPVDHRRGSVVACVVLSTLILILSIWIQDSVQAWLVRVLFTVALLMGLLTKSAISSVKPTY